MYPSEATVCLLSPPSDTPPTACDSVPVEMSHSFQFPNLDSSERLFWIIPYKSFNFMPCFKCWNLVSNFTMKTVLSVIFDIFNCWKYRKFSNKGTPRFFPNSIQDNFRVFAYISANNCPITYCSLLWKMEMSSTWSWWMHPLRVCHSSGCVY